VPGAPAASPEENVTLHRFDIIETIPAHPRAGQDFLVRARVLPAGFDQRPACFIHNEAGGAGGGVNEIEPGLYECRGVVGRSLGTVLWVARERDSWVRSPLLVIRPEDSQSAGRPASTITDVAIVQRGDSLRATVHVSPAPLVNPLGTTTGTAEVLRLPMSHAAFLGTGIRLVPTALGELRGEAPLVTGTDPNQPSLEAAERDPDYVVLSFAATTNDLGGVDVSDLIEHGEAACADVRACIRS